MTSPAPASAPSLRFTPKAVNFSTVHLSILLAVFWGVVAMAAIALGWPKLIAAPILLLGIATTTAAGAFLALLCTDLMNRVRRTRALTRILAALIVSLPVSAVYSVLGLMMGGGLFQPDPAGGMLAQLGLALLIHYPLFMVWCLGIALLDASPVSRLANADIFHHAITAPGQASDRLGEFVSGMATENPGLSFAFVWRYMLAFWSIYLLSSIVADFTYTQNFNQIWRNCMTESAAFLLGIGAHFLVLRPTRQLELPIRCVLVLGTAVLMTCVYISVMWVAWFEIFPWNAGQTEINTAGGWASLATAAPSWFINSIPPSIACLAVYLALEAVSQTRLRERQVYETAVLARDAQIKMLRFQLNPHFMFNTLNAISSLVLDGRNVEAESMILRLSGFLRFALQAAPDDKVTLEEEIVAQTLYLDIEKARFDSRLEVEIDASPEAREALLPSLILQPILENSIKHGVSNTSDRVSIKISARRHGDELVIEIVDSGTVQPAVPVSGTGVGLANIRSRLAAIYGARAGLSAERGADDSFAVRLHLPFEIAGHGRAARKAGS